MTITALVNDQPDAYEAAHLDATAISSLSFSGLALFSRFRAHRLFSEAARELMIRREILSLVQNNGQCFTFHDGEQLMGVLALAPLSWDSTHFGIGMGRAVLLTSPSASRLRLARSIADRIHLAAAALQVRHWSVEIDLDDYQGLNSLIAAGFEVLDVKKTYCASRMRKGMERPRLAHCVRPFRQEDRPAIERLLETPSFPGRFSRDTVLSPDAVLRMYRLWFGQMLENQHSTSNVLVFEKQGRVVACGAIDELDLSRLGVSQRMMSGGLYVSSQEGTGGYLPVMHRLTEEAIARHGLVETTVSANNSPACRVLDLFHSHVVTRYALRLFLAPPQGNE